MKYSQKKRKTFFTIIAVVFVSIFLLYPIPTENHGWQAALYGFERDKVVLQEDIGGIAGKTEYYFSYQVRILFFFFTVENPEDTRTGQW